ncbi:MAG TPA: vitamin K epoxide reductase family protein [Verrucomicrobiae bacterium]|nr:vitamin K epoxide reductase family protein [Verrucomicrobiae bacterium]
MNRSRRSWPWWRWLLTGLSALALTLSAYLGWHYLSGGSVIGCGGGSPCDQVLNSRWSVIGGRLPVSGLAAGTYLAMLVASLFIGPATEVPLQRLAWRAMLILVGAAAGSAVWFSIVQERILGAFCPYCMATHITGLLLATLVVWQAPRHLGRDSSDGVQTNSVPAQDVFPPAAARRATGRWQATGLAFAGVSLAGIVAACQIAFTPPAVYRGGESQNNLPALDPHTVPLIGSPDAPYVVTLLYDYNCPHCQELHWMLDEVVRRYNGKLAFVLCPAPLNPACNPYVPRKLDEFADSCELAKIALAVWVARREAFPAFDRWMFSYDSGDRWHPRTLDEARTKAVELVGKASFDTALTDPRVDSYLQTCVRIYGKTVQSATDPERANAVPKLVFGSHWVIPEPNNADDLVTILQKSLNLPGPERTGLKQ